MDQRTPNAGSNRPPGPYLLVLGIAQDAGVPQAGDKRPEMWSDPARRRLAACVALVDPATGGRWLFDATPDFREQLARLDRDFPVPHAPGLDGIFLTHAHAGHYAGLIFLGRESMAAENVPVFAMPLMSAFLRGNKPWRDLADRGNIELRPLGAGEAVELVGGLAVTSVPVRHREEDSETVAFRIDGPRRSALYLPDVDGWEGWPGEARVEDLLGEVDVAFLDGTFYSAGELPGRDVAGEIPHPTLERSMERFAPLPPAVRAKIRFIHLNHTNPALLPSSPERASVAAKGFQLAAEGERFTL
jgi:pyrroloquinoline quinone biosynthesis protein B